MRGDKYTVVKGYKVFQGSDSSGEPMDEPSEQQLYGWLCSRGFTEELSGKIIERIDNDGSVTITLP